MPRSYSDIMDTHNVDLYHEISRVVLVIMYGALSKLVTWYAYVKDRYHEYKYRRRITDSIRPTQRYCMTEDGRETDFTGLTTVQENRVYIEEWMDTKGHKKMIVRYAGDAIPTHWDTTPFTMPPARCPWVWVGDRETEVDYTRTFDKFLVPGNVLKKELVIKLVNATNLMYIETKTFNQVKFPGDGITIEVDVDPI